MGISSADSEMGKISECDILCTKSEGRGGGIVLQENSDILKHEKMNLYE